MKTTLALLAATTVLGTLIAIPAIGAVRTLDLGSTSATFSVSADTTPDGMIRLASGDDEDGDDEDEDEDCDDEEEEGAAGGCSAGANPAPAGTVAPPANGLFGNGAAPQVQVN